MAIAERSDQVGANKAVDAGEKDFQVLGLGKNVTRVTKKRDTRDNNSDE